MTHTVSVTLPEDLYRRLEELRRQAGGTERSKVIQRALALYMDLQGPDPKVVRRWQAAYARVGSDEAVQSEKWRGAQAGSLGQP